MTTFVDPAREMEAKLPGFEAVGALGAKRMPRFDVAADASLAHEQLFVRSARLAFGELDELLAELQGQLLDGAVLLRRSLVAADCFTRRLVPALLRHLGHDDLAAAVENLPEICGTRQVHRAIAVFSSLTYLVPDSAVAVFSAAIEAFEVPAPVSDDELDRQTPAMRPFVSSFPRSLAEAVHRADRIMSSETSGTGDALPHPLRPSVEVATVAGHSKLRSLAS